VNPAYLKIRDLIYRISGIYHCRGKAISSGRALRAPDGRARRGQSFGVFGAPHDARKPRRGTASAAERNHHRRNLHVPPPLQLDALRNVILPQILAGQRFDQPQTSALLVRRLLDRRRAPHVGHVSTRRKSQAAGGLDLRHSCHRFERQFARKRHAPGFTESMRCAVPATRCAGNTSKMPVTRNSRPTICSKRRSVLTALTCGTTTRCCFRKGSDVIFCCNVLIYFDLASKRRVVQHFLLQSVARGLPFSWDSAESLFQVDDSFRLVHFPGTTAYWKPTATQAGGVKK
jgi:hypothetical protein